MCGFRLVNRDFAHGKTMEGTGKEQAAAVCSSYFPPGLGGIMLALAAAIVVVRRVVGAGAFKLLIY